MENSVFLFTLKNKLVKEMYQAKSKLVQLKYWQSLYFTPWTYICVKITLKGRFTHRRIHYMDLQYWWKGLDSNANKQKSHKYKHTDSLSLNSLENYLICSNMGLSKHNGDFIFKNWLVKLQKFALTCDNISGVIYSK